MDTPLVQHTLDTPYPVGPVHFYSTELKGELALFDTGPCTAEAEEYHREHFNLSELRHVFITHCHIDHYGLARWLESETDATVYIPYRDYLKITRHDQRMEAMYLYLTSIGFSERYLAELRRVMTRGAIFPDAPHNFKIAEKDIPTSLNVEVTPCPGHSQSDLVYLVGEYAVTGDTLLKDIFQSPLLDIDLESGQRFSNYNAYCTSLLSLADLRDKKVMPGHRFAIEGVDEVIVTYISKLLQRVEQLLPHADKANVAGIIDSLFCGAAQNSFHVYLKASEVLFMQDFLASPHLLADALKSINLYEPVADRFHSVTGR